MKRWRPDTSGGGPRRALAALALLVVAGVLVVLVLGDDSPFPRSSTSTTGSSAGTASVQRRDLVETDTQSGNLSYASPQTVYNRLGGTITWLPSVGAVIKPGQALFRVGSQAVTLLIGRTPAYRDLGPSDSAGLDILELNRNLIALGFNPEGIVVDDKWQAATTAGVDVFRASLGEAETGKLTLGQIVFLPGAQVVSAVSAQLGSQAALRSPDPRPELVSLTTTTVTPTPPVGTTRSRRRRPRNPKYEAALIALLKAQAAQLKAEAAQLRAEQAKNPNPRPGGGSPSGGSPASSNKGNTGGTGSGDAPATAVLQTSSTKLVVTVQLDPSRQSEAEVGERVTVEMPSGKTVGGRISAISSVAQSSTGNGTSGNGGGGDGASGGSGNVSSTIPVTIVLGGRPSGGGLDQASVSVTFARARANRVLSVPVTSLLATQGGTYAVQAARAPHHLIPVRTGLFAAGYVEISGPGIHPGLQVTDSQG